MFGVRNYRAGNTVHYNVADQIRQSNEQKPTPVEKPVEAPQAHKLYLFADCLRQIQDFQTRRDKAGSLDLTDSAIVDRLDHLVDRDPKFIWDHIPRLFIQKTRTSDFHEILRLTLCVCDHFEKTQQNTEISNKIWDYFLSEMAFGELSMLPTPFFESFCDLVVSRKITQKQIKWEMFITPRNDFEKYVAWIEFSLLMGSPFLNSIPHFLRNANEALNFMHLAERDSKKHYFLPKFLKKEVEEPDNFRNDLGKLRELNKKYRQQLSELENRRKLETPAEAEIASEIPVPQIVAPKEEKSASPAPEIVVETHVVCEIQEQEIIVGPKELNPATFTAQLDEAMVHESSFYSLIQQDLKGQFVTFLARENLEPEVIAYLANNPQFLIWLKEQDGELVVSDTFITPFIERVAEMKEWGKIAHLENCRKLFEGKLPERFSQIRFDVYSAQLLQKEIQDDVEKGLTQLIYGLCSQGVVAFAVPQGDALCKRVSELAIAHHIKTVPFHSVWLKLTESVVKRQVYPLDKLIAEAFLVELPKNVNIARAMKFSERLLMSDDTIDKAIRLIAKAVFSEKRSTLVVSDDILKKIHRIKPEGNYEGIQELCRDLWRLCSHVQATIKKAKQKNTSELKLVFNDLLQLLQKHSQVHMNAQFWDGVVTLGRELALLNDERPTGIVEIDRRLMTNSLTRTLKRLNEKNVTGKQLYETFSANFTILERLNKELQRTIIEALIFQINKYVTAERPEMLLELGKLFCEHNLRLLWNDPHYRQKTKKGLNNLLNAVCKNISVEELDIPLNIAASTKSIEPEILDTLITALLLRFSSSESLTETEVVKLTHFVMGNFPVLKEGEPVLRWHQNLFKLGLIALSRPEFSSVDGLVKLQKYIEFQLSQKDFELALVNLKHYIDIALTYKERYSELDTMILFSYYSLAINSHKFAKQFRDTFSFANLQMNLLRLHHRKGIRGFEMTALLGHLIAETEDSTFDEEFDEILKGYLDSSVVRKGRLSDDLIEKVAKTIETNHYNMSRLILFFTNWFLLGDPDQLDSIESMFRSFTKGISPRQKNVSAEYVTDLIDAVIDYSQRPFDTESVGRATACLADLVNCQPLSKSLAPTTRKYAMEHIASCLVYILDDEFVQFESENNALEERMDDILGDRSVLSAPNYDALYQRSDWRKNLLHAEVDVSGISVCDAFLYGFVTFGRLMDYLDPASKVSNSYASLLDLQFKDYFDYDELNHVFVETPFKGQKRREFLFAFINELMDYYWEGNGGINTVTVFFIWELIKEFSKSYPQNSVDISKLMVKFVFLPQQMSLRLAQLHHTLCCTWIIGSPTVGFERKEILYVKAYLESALILPAIQNETVKEELYDVFYPKFKAYSSIYSLICLTRLSKDQRPRADQYVLEQHPTAFVKFLAGVQHHIEEVKILHSLYPEFKKTATLLLRESFVGDEDKAHIAGLLVIYYHLCHEGEIESDLPDNREMRHYYLDKILEEEWLEGDDKEFLRLAEIVES